MNFSNCKFLRKLSLLLTLTLMPTSILGNETSLLQARRAKVVELSATYNEVSDLIQKFHADIATWVADGTVTLDLLKNTELTWWFLEDKYGINYACFYKDVGAYVPLYSVDTTDMTDAEILLTMGVSDYNSNLLLSTEINSDVLIKKDQTYVRLDKGVVVETYYTLQEQEHEVLIDGDWVTQTRYVTHFVVVTANVDGILNIEKYVEGEADDLW